MGQYDAANGSLVSGERPIKIKQPHRDYPHARKVAVFRQAIRITNCVVLVLVTIIKRNTFEICL